MAYGVGSWKFEMESVVVESGDLRVARGRVNTLDVVKDGLGVASAGRHEHLRRLSHVGWAHIV